MEAQRGELLFQGGRPVETRLEELGSIWVWNPGPLLLFYMLKNWLWTEELKLLFKINLWIKKRKPVSVSILPLEQTVSWWGTTSIRPAAWWVYWLSKAATRRAPRGEAAGPWGRQPGFEDAGKPGRVTPVVNSRGCPVFLSCSGSLIHNGLPHSSAPSLGVRSPRWTKPLFKDPAETRLCYGSCKLEAWRGDLLFGENHHLFSVGRLVSR